MAAEVLVLCDATNDSTTFCGCSLDVEVTVTGSQSGLRYCVLVTIGSHNFMPRFLSTQTTDTISSFASLKLGDV